MDYSKDTKIKRERREKIVNIAKQMFFEKGIANTTIFDIAEEANMGRSTIYEYFSSKQELLLYVREQYLDKIYNLDFEINLTLTGIEQLERIIEVYFDAMINNPRAILFFNDYLGYVQNIDSKEETLPTKVYVTHLYINNAILQGQVDGSLNMPSPDKRIVILLEALIGAATRFAMMEQRNYGETFVNINKDDMKDLVKVLLKGINA